MQIGLAHKGKSISEAHKQAITDKLSGGSSPKAKAICMVHKDSPQQVHRFLSVKSASDTLCIGYQALRSQAQSMFRTGVSSEPNRQGWICLTEMDAERPEDAVRESIERVSTRSKTTPRAKGASHAKSRSIRLESTSGEIRIFDSILGAAAFIGISEATLRYHEKRVQTLRKDSNFIQKSWKVKYIEVVG